MSLTHFRSADHSASATPARRVTIQTLQDKKSKGTPIVASNIDTTGTMKMAQVLHELNMLTCLHKYYPLDQLIDFFTTDPARTPGPPGRRRCAGSGRSIGSMR